MEKSELKYVVASTRVRLARNIEGYPFPSHLKTEKQARDIIRLVTSGISRLDGFDDNRFDVHYMGGIAAEEAQILMENHLISPNLIKKGALSAAIINSDKSVSIMINEEDHLREQCIIKGFALETAYKTMSQIDASLSTSMKFAYDEQLGYLTACPTNLGTGLRASVMLFLPALTIKGEIPKVYRSVSRLGLTVRGMYGEGSEAEGYMYQISNEVTLGVTEEEIVSQVKNVVEKISELETLEREKLKNSPSALDIKDECMRSYGILTNCAKLTTGELIRFSANVKLGASLGYIPVKDISSLDDLTVKMSPANIIKAANRQLTTLERDMYRAEYVSKHIAELTERQ